MRYEFWFVAGWTSLKYRPPWIALAFGLLSIPLPSSLAGVKKETLPFVDVGMSVDV